MSDAGEIIQALGNVSSNVTMTSLWRLGHRHRSEPELDTISFDKFDHRVIVLRHKRQTETRLSEKRYFNFLY